MGVDWFLGRLGWGVWLLGKMAPAKPYFTDPHPDPSPQGGGSAGVLPCEPLTA
jgi:hypothetical protein